jgi:ankyrin repeat protein
VEALVKAGANSTALSKGGRTPLMTAANNNKIYTLDFLLEQPAAKATINAISCNYWTALLLASFMAMKPPSGSSSPPALTPPSPPARTPPSI